MKFVLMLLFTSSVIGATKAKDVISEYGLQDLAVGEIQTADSACPALAESTYTWYNRENGLIDSQFSYFSSDKSNCCRWMDYYDHRIFPNGVRVTRILQVNTVTGDTAVKTLNEYDKSGNLTVSDRIDLDYHTRTISAYEYNVKGRRTKYHHIVVGRNRVHDTLRTEVTSYGDGTCPEKMKILGNEVFRYFICTEFDSIAAAIAIKDSADRVHYTKVYDKNHQLIKWNEYSWHLEGTPLRKVTVYDYDGNGHLIMKTQFGPPDLFNRSNSPDEFVPRVIDYFTCDEKGRVIKFVRKQRAEED